MRDKLLRFHCEQVEKGNYPEYKYELDGQWIYTIYQGCWSPYRWTKDSGGVTMKYINAMGSTTVHTANLDGVVETLMDVADNIDYINEQSKSIGDYLTSDKGKWGRQDSF